MEFVDSPYAGVDILPALEFVDPFLADLAVRSDLRDWNGGVFQEEIGFIENIHVENGTRVPHLLSTTMELLFIFFMRT